MSYVFSLNLTDYGPNYIGVNNGDTAWMLAASALVFVMTPGIAFFYGGMVSEQHNLVICIQGCHTCFKKAGYLEHLRHVHLCRGIC